VNPVAGEPEPEQEHTFHFVCPCGYRLGIQYGGDGEILAVWREDETLG